MILYFPVIIILHMNTFCKKVCAMLNIKIALGMLKRQQKVLNILVARYVSETSSYLIFNRIVNLVENSAKRPSVEWNQWTI